MYIKRIAVDLAKNVFQLAVSDKSGQVLERKRLNRIAFLKFITQLTEPTEFIFEACGTAHYWGRTVNSMKHKATILHAAYVTPYRRRNKNDKNDCDAILDAARAIKIKSIPVKTEQQQHTQHLHCIRELYKHNLTQRINILRSIYREQGFDCPEGKEPFLKIAFAIADEPVMLPLKTHIDILLAEIKEFMQLIKDCEKTDKVINVNNPIIERLEKISGIGFLTASAFVATVGSPERFKNGRTVSAFFGITPKEYSSGHTRKLSKISLAGNTYVRTLFVHCARSALQAARRCATNTPEKLTRLQLWALKLSERVNFNKATVALANKLVRICWSLWMHDRDYDGNYTPTVSL
jgi:transposase